MSIQRRNTIVRGPAIVHLQWRTGSGSANFHQYVFRTKGDVVFTPENQTFNVESSELGIIDRRASELVRTVRFTPVGTIDATGKGILWPHLAKLPGQSLFAAYDVECFIKPVAESSGTFECIHLWNVAVTKMPDIIISAVQTQIGEVEFRGIIDDDYDWGQDMHVSYCEDNDDIPALDALNPSNILTTPGTVAWGTAMTDIKTAEGVRIGFEMDTQDEVEDETGVYDITLTGLRATARLSPVAGFDMSKLVDIMHENDDQLRGGSIYRNDLVVTSRDPGGLCVTLFGAALLSAPMTYGATARRFGELVFEGVRGTGNAIASVTIAGSSTRPQPQTKVSAADDDGEGDGEGTGT